MAPESVVLHSGALVFNGAMVTMLPLFMCGGTFVVHRAFDADAFIETVERERVTHTMLVPSQIVAILDAPSFDPSRLTSLQMILSLGAPLHNEQKDRLNRLLPDRFHELYGLTEGFVTILDRDDARRKAGSVGVPPPFYEMRIVGEDGRALAAREVGEIVGRGPITMPGYYNRPDLTAQALAGDGCTPATSGTSTRTATCSWSTARRT
jgi:acyl-CoA synthetase (AMP-forming)/AMP-acid ligase II